MFPRHLYFIPKTTGLLAAQKSGRSLEPEFSSYFKLDVCSDSDDPFEGLPENKFYFQKAESHIVRKLIDRWREFNLLSLEKIH